MEERVYLVRLTKMKESNIKEPHLYLITNKHITADECLKFGRENRILEQRTDYLKKKFRKENVHLLY